MAGLELIVGTYEEYTVGYKVEPFSTDPSRQYLKETFSTHNHTASVRVLASHNKYLASGGADDRICVFDLENGTLMDELLHHQGTINCLTFSVDGSYLFSGSFDGTISAINMKRLVVDKVWKNAHKSAVLCITIHPHGKVALSLGADMMLRTWDMVSGRTIYTRGLRSDPKYGGNLSLVEWSPDGKNFVLVGNRVVDVVSLESTKSIRTVECSTRPVSLCWISESEIAVGLDDGHLLMFNIYNEEEPDQFRAYESRLKAIACVGGNYLAAASSAGDISLWKIDGNDFLELCTTNIGCRPTCMLLVEADKLGLHRYLNKQTDSKDELRKQLKKFQTVGKVTVEHENPTENASFTTENKQKKRVVTNETTCFTSTPVVKNKKMVKKPVVKSASVSKTTSMKNTKRKAANHSCSGMSWLEEDVVAGEVAAEKVSKSKKSADLLNKTDGGKNVTKKSNNWKSVSF
ncbi:p21-activated protein kinase-interacting protein 1-like [Malaya genurostris]|uniref:p21-activated protein kinase-interacting protein 1-like n=1 Tax=Malaya genurostris TaxID=325434 RepID=UPI0026F409AE|nr:p21-activated protein kinase-interacting protein 1-like [Malaya genurostris]